MTTSTSNTTSSNTTSTNSNKKANKMIIAKPYFWTEVSSNNRDITYVIAPPNCLDSKGNLINTHETKDKCLLTPGMFVDMGSAIQSMRSDNTSVPSNDIVVEILNLEYPNEGKDVQYCVLMDDSTVNYRRYMVPVDCFIHMMNKVARGEYLPSSLLTLQYDVRVWFRTIWRHKDTSKPNMRKRVMTVWAEKKGMMKLSPKSVTHSNSLTQRLDSIETMVQELKDMLSQVSIKSVVTAATPVVFNNMPLNEMLRKTIHIVNTVGTRDKLERGILTLPLRVNPFQYSYQQHHDLSHHLTGYNALLRANNHRKKNKLTRKEWTGLDQLEADGLLADFCYIGMKFVNTDSPTLRTLLQTPDMIAVMAIAEAKGKTLAPAAKLYSDAPVDPSEVTAEEFTTEVVETPVREQLLATQSDTQILSKPNE